MKRKFESELARKVADGNSGPSNKKKGVLFAAVATCALLFGSAAFSIAMSENDNGRPVAVLVMTDKMDELVAYPDTDLSVDVKRMMNLKAKSFTPPGDNGCDEYTKFVYSVNVKIYDSQAYAYSGMDVGMLVIDYESLVDLTTTTTVTVNGVDLSQEEADACASFDIGSTTTTSVVISLPIGDYADGTDVSFNVSIKLPVWTWSGSVSEFPMPGVLGLDDPYGVSEITWS
jgi:hypothetical protein